MNNSRNEARPATRIESGRWLGRGSKANTACISEIFRTDRPLLTSELWSCIADSLRSLEQGITVFKLGNETFSTEKENFDLKKNRKLKYSSYTLC